MRTGSGRPTSRLEPNTPVPSANQLQASSISALAAIVPTRRRAPERYSRRPGLETSVPVAVTSIYLGIAIPRVMV